MEAVQFYIKYYHKAAIVIIELGYSKYETGENDIPTQVLIKLAGFYKTTTDYILGISDRRDPI